MITHKQKLIIKDFLTGKSCGKFLFQPEELPDLSYTKAWLIIEIIDKFCDSETAEDCPIEVVDTIMGLLDMAGVPLEKQFRVIYYMQEHDDLRLIPDTYSQCGECGKIFDSENEGTLTENMWGHDYPGEHKHYCDECWPAFDPRDSDCDLECTKTTCPNYRARYEHHCDLEAWQVYECIYPYYAGVNTGWMSI